MKRAVIVCGCPNSGKTSYAEFFKYAGFLHLERDQIRTEYFNLAAWKDWDWNKEPEVTKVWEEIFQFATESGVDVVISDTLIKSTYRASIVKRLKDKGYDVTLTILNPPLEALLERNSARGERAVDEDIIRKMYSSLNKEQV